MKTPPLYAHQTADIDFLTKTPLALNFSDCGTGKTRTSIETLRHQLAQTKKRALILAPKSILEPAWGQDLNKYAPELTYSIAYAENRAEAFNQLTDIVITNHDAVSWIEKCIKQRTPILKDFSHLIIDESTAFRNPTQRATSLIKLKDHFQTRLLMTGTPYINSLSDLWRQVYICDNGQRLGKSFYAFRNHVSIGRTLGNGVTLWEDKPGMEAVIFQLINDITIRHKLEDCIDIPPSETISIPFNLSKSHRALYDKLLKEAILEFETGNVSALNAAVLTSKLLQLLSGAVYDTNGNYKLIAPDRYELVAELAQQRPQSIVAFRWQHQKDLLSKQLHNFAVIDGTTPIKQRNQIVAEYQAGQIQTLLIHPRAGAHGLTLTAGYDTIWASPTYSAEEFIQLNHRIYRAGQTKKTRTLLVTATNTIEEDVYLKLQGKLTRGSSFLHLFLDSKQSHHLHYRRVFAP